jgi:hypothetical protein
MNRQKRTLIVMLVAVGVAGLASFGVYRAIASIPERRVEIATKYAVVASAPMPVGTLLTRDSVRLVAWPEKTPLQGGFSNVDDVVDRGLISSVVENEPISESKLAPKEAGAGLPPTITKGMRAISVKVNEVIGRRRLRRAGHAGGTSSPSSKVRTPTTQSRASSSAMSRCLPPERGMTRKSQRKTGRRFDRRW